MDIFLVPVNNMVSVQIHVSGDTSTPTTVNWLLEEQLFRQSAHTKFDCIYWPFSLI